MSKSSAVPFLRSAFDGFADVVSAATGLQCLDLSLAQQSYAEEADINTIVNKFLRTGEFPDAVSRPRFGDFTGVVDNYQDALNLVIAADEAFMALPANIRKRFDNDPAKYVSFFEDPRNFDEAISLGLADPVQDSSSSSSKEHVEEESSAAVAASDSSSSKGGKKADKA